MPKGTEEQKENVRSNAILAAMKQSERTRKIKIKRWPKGDPQWFPFEWLVIAAPR